MIRINLLPFKELEAEVSRRHEIAIGSVILGSLVLLLVAAHVYQALTLSRLEKELAALRSEIQTLNLKVKEVGDLQNRIKDFKGKHKIIEELNRKKSGPVLVMESLSNSTPTSLWLTDLRESGGGVTMNGLAVDNQTVADFMKALAASKYFTSVELIETTQGAGPTASLKKFSIKTGVVYRPPDPAPDAKAKAEIQAKKEEKKG
ncbi:MAG TPA: PilN domain-containing protein [Candidatus Binatia bacterium]|jgi:type IV pilus assembly protein PilN